MSAAHHNYIERVRIKGFWGTHSVESQIHRDVTFFIGPNGTGKTTFINLLAAAIEVDFSTLSQNDFELIEVFMGSDKSKSPTSKIEVKKGKSTRTSSFEYKIYSGKEGEKKPKTFNIDAYVASVDDEFLMSPSYDYESRSVRQKIEKEISEHLSVDWISIHRMRNRSYSPYRERRNLSPVDQSISDLENELVRLFSTISRTEEEAKRRFQASIFDSLVSVPTQKMFEQSIFEFDLDSSKQKLAEVFNDLSFIGDLSGDRLDVYFDLVEPLVKDFPKDGGYGLEELSRLESLWRINLVLERWDQLQEELAEAGQQRDKFLEIIKGLFLRKTPILLDSNEIVFHTTSGKTLKPVSLSSGEKQILILLGEMLLQRNKGVTYIADEPEISLHVLWQEKLISSLRQLNENAQIIVATHSPDIVGALGNRAINMEAIVN